MPKEHFQKDMRRNFNAQDQFGRVWLVTIEKETGDPCSAVPTFTDPLRTPGNYVEPRMNASSLEVNFGKWLADVEEGWGDWVHQFHEIGMALYSDAYNADQALKNPKPDHRQRAGPRPLNPKLVERARDGDKELLGLKELSEETLKALPREYAQALRRAREVAVA